MSLLRIGISTVCDCREPPVLQEAESGQAVGVHAGFHPAHHPLRLFRALPPGVEGIAVGVVEQALPLSGLDAGRIEGQGKRLLGPVPGGCVDDPQLGDRALRALNGGGDSHPSVAEGNKALVV